MTAEIRLTNRLEVYPSSQAGSLTSGSPKGSAEQLFEAIDQPLDREGFDQVFYVMLGQEEGDFCIGGNAGDENEAIGQRWAHFLRLQIKLITPQPRHLEIADHR